MELNLSRSVKNHKKGFCKYTGDRRKNRENAGPSLNKKGDVVTQEKAEVLNATFASIFTSNTSLQKPQFPDTRRKVWSKEDVCLMEDALVRESLGKLDRYKSTGPDDMLPQVLRELTDIIVRPSITDQSCPSEKSCMISLIRFYDEKSRFNEFNGGNM